MLLRKGRTKAILEASIDSALLAVEIYNKPRTTFRSQAYISLMIMAWTRLFHAHFHNNIGDRFYYKNEKNKYQLIDGKKKAWELTECLKKIPDMAEAVRKNLEFFIKLRNRIEHRHIDAKEVDVSIFGECQSLLFNYENYLIKLFGSEYSINEALAILDLHSLMPDYRRPGIAGGTYSSPKSPINASLGCVVVHHQLCQVPTEWQFSSVHRLMMEGIYPPNWGECPVEFGLDGRWE